VEVSVRMGKKKKHSKKDHFMGFVFFGSMIVVTGIILSEVLL